ncbi:hypothetical protein BLA50215_07778 [Burkholderia lata]|uniref:hypothetical protein n=1 Tax=Burkholderia lata (strain ATCC 17760 / DSM 23089 / LMG 22485 / NCIMB 9086 / R18194 / 383) TaxID=482957 RepID=UPI001453E2BB|nr:hypothetical protein [Burkholderia lata]VWD63948.1 hypothetical protein BLA50215_07778 [Burkholderia lata]
MRLSDPFFFPTVAGDHRRCVEWPFYLNHRQRALLRALHDAWGDDVIVQIYGGYIRIRADSGDWRFSEAELDLAIAINRTI